ncbi:MAG: OmpH family outer membrane protein [bacterium]|nr:OmpH family outer membrane protein [bacterium]
MKSCQGLTAAICFAVLGLALPQPATAEEKIAFVDFQRVFEQSDVIKKMNEKLQDSIRAEQQTLEKKRDALERTKEELEKKIGVLNPEARTKKEEELRAELKDLKRYAGDKEEEFQRRGSTLMQGIMKDLTDIVKEIGKSRNFSAVVERSTGGVIYFDPGSDITEEVVKEYDKRNKNR